MNIQSIALDVSKRPEPKPTLYIGQGDNVRPIVEATITDHGEPLDLGAYDVSLEIRVGAKHVYPGTASGSVATFPLDGEIESGSGFAYAVIESADMRTSTQRVNVEVLEGSE